MRLRRSSRRNHAVEDKLNHTESTIRHLVGNTAPICKLSMELYLSIADFLDLETRLSFAQSFRAIFLLSNGHSSYWKDAGISSITLPRLVEEAAHTGKELRASAVNTLRCKWAWRQTDVQSIRKLRVPLLSEREMSFERQFFIPPGTRWLFQYGHLMNTFKSEISVFDMLKGRNLGTYKLHHVVLSAAGVSVSPNQVALAFLSASSRRANYIAIFTADFITDGRGSIYIEFTELRKIDSQMIFDMCVLRNGWICWSSMIEKDVMQVERWDDETLRAKIRSSGGSDFLNIKIGPESMVALTSDDTFEVYPLPTRSPSTPDGADEPTDKILNSTSIIMMQGNVASVLEYTLPKTRRADESSKFHAVIAGVDDSISWNTFLLDTKATTDQPDEIEETSVMAEENLPPPIEPEGTTAGNSINNGNPVVEQEPVVDSTGNTLSPSTLDNISIAPPFSYLSPVPVDFFVASESGNAIIRPTLDNQICLRRYGCSADKASSRLLLSGRKRTPKSVLMPLVFLFDDISGIALTASPSSNTFADLHFFW